MAVEMDGTSKGLLGAFAVFALGSGIASLIYGIFLLLRYIGIEYNYGMFNLYTTSILLIVIGGLLIIAVILGVFGALKDKANVRLVTLILLFVLFAALAGVGVWGMVNYKIGRLQKSIDADIKTITDKNADSDPVLKKKADYLNQKYNCCSAYTTYDERANELVIPESCCINSGCTSLNNERKYFEKGCASVYFETKAKVVFHLAILTLVAAGLVLFALIFYGIVSHHARAGYAVVSRG